MLEDNPTLQGLLARAAAITKYKRIGLRQWWKWSPQAVTFRIAPRFTHRLSSNLLYFFKKMREVSGSVACWTDWQQSVIFSTEMCKKCIDNIASEQGVLWVSPTPSWRVAELTDWQQSVIFSAKR